MTRQMDDTNCFIATRGSALRGTAAPYQEVVYSNPSKKVKPETSNQNLTKSTPPNNNEEIDMKKARYEILKFARSNVKSATKQKTDRELALELGAKRQKKKAIDYKLLLSKKKRTKERKERKEEIKKLTQRFNGKSLIKKNRSKKRSTNFNRGRSGILGVYGKAKKDD